MSLIGKFASVGSATMASRVLGFVREAMIAALLGAGPVTDAFYAALRFPNLFRRLFAEGAFNAAFIPLFAKELEGGGQEAARRFGADVASVLIPTLLVLSALAMLAMPVLVATIVAPGFTDSPEKFDLTVLLTRIMFPYLFCMSLVAMLSGILNSLRHYFLAAFVPVLLNLILIAVLLLSLTQGFGERTTGIWLAWGVFLSGIAQLALLLWGTRKAGYRLTVGLPRLTPDVRRMLALMGPAVLTGGIVQINLLVGQIIASGQDGGIGLLNFADRIVQLPLGVIGVAIGVVLLPELSRALRSGNHAEAERLQDRSLEFALALTLPAAVGLIVMPGPIVSLIYERGAFTALATDQTAAALAGFAAGLPAFVLIKVFQPSFYAREDMRMPMWFSGAAVVVNIVASLLLFPDLGHVGIAIATSVSGWLNCLLLAGLAWRRGDFRPSGGTLKRIALCLLSALAMGAVLFVLHRSLGIYADTGPALLKLPVVAGLIGIAAIVYFGLAFATGAIDRRELAGLSRRKGRS